MGEIQASLSPFLFFTDHNAELAQAVRDGRRREFSSFGKFSEPDTLAKIPDPNAVETFQRSKPLPNPNPGNGREHFYQHLLSLRRAEIIPRLDGARAIDATAVGPAAVLANWRLGDGALLTLASNLGQTAAAVPLLTQKLLFATSETTERSAKIGILEGHSTIALLERP